MKSFNQSWSVNTVSFLAQKVFRICFVLGVHTLTYHAMLSFSVQLDGPVRSSVLLCYMYHSFGILPSVNHLLPECNYLYNDELLPKFNVVVPQSRWSDTFLIRRSLPTFEGALCSKQTQPGNNTGYKTDRPLRTRIWKTVSGLGTFTFRLRLLLMM